MSARDRPQRRDPAVEAAEDARLVAGAVAGDRGMFDVLYRRHLDAVFARLTRIIGPGPERDDLVQNIFLDVHRALPGFRGASSFATFLHRIVINVAYEQLARQRRLFARMTRLEDHQFDEMIDPHESPEGRARLRQELAWVFRSLERLSPKRRIAFTLVAIEGLSLDEAVALVGGSREAVKQRVLEARRELNRERKAFDTERGQAAGPDQTKGAKQS
jgi:RNA polymerase sigma-70 factor (ECF subfamily)